VLRALPGQELELSVHAVRYRRERWLTPEGQTLTAPLRAGTYGHFGPNLRRFVLMQYHQAQSTLPRLVALLQYSGLSISKREVQRLLTKEQVCFLAEAPDVLRAGLASSSWISVDDTGALPHAGHSDFGLNEAAFGTMRSRGLAGPVIACRATIRM
jgi:hypothetical protein